MKFPIVAKVGSTRAVLTTVTTPATAKSTPIAAAAASTTTHVSTASATAATTSVAASATTSASKSTTASKTRSSHGCQLWWNFLFRFSHDLHESMCTLPVFARKKSVRKSFGSGTSRTSNAMDIIFYPVGTRWHIVVHNNSNVFDIKS